MPTFLPLKAVLPTAENAAYFVSKSRDFHTDQEIQAILSNNPLSYLQIIRPTLVENKLALDLKYARVLKNYKRFLSENIISETQDAYYYLYKKINPEGRRTIGFLGLVDLEDFINQKIKKHEETLQHRKVLFARYLSYIKIHTEPVLLTYANQTDLSNIMEALEKQPPLISFSKRDQSQHYLWAVPNVYAEVIRESMQGLSCFYIADGHHRMGSSVLCYQENKDNPLARYVLSYLISDKDLHIYDFNRLLTDLNGYSLETFIDQLSNNYNVKPMGAELFFPKQKGCIGFYCQGQFYALEEKNKESQLDVVSFEKYILKPLLNINDTRTDKRIGFKRGRAGIKSAKAIKEAVDSGKYKAGFLFFPISVEELKHVANKGLKMPPKSTYIEPKMLNGLVIYSML